ncbi:MAG TPA: phosphotransferase [Oscillospiraceae bacterium]|nr:phosphotransferase [Oscillospiraceae bacterium]HRW56597.1 phosphotransferase [Oscillospiraceae bacterium]
MALVKTNIDEAIARIADWKGKKVSYAPISGGITNPNFKVNVDGKDFFLKIPGAGTDFIDRPNCHAANVIAAESHAGPQVYYYFEDTGVEVFEWLDGYRQVTFGDVYTEKIFTKIFQNISAFHNTPGKTLPLTQNVFEQAWDMIDRAKQGNYLPPWHDKMEYILHTTEDAFNNNGMVLKPCHNDFWTNNLMYNEEKDDLKIIDWEYASMNDPYYDLGLIATTNYLTEAMDVELCKVYHGGNFDEMGFAKMKLYKIVGDIKWAYWALQQSFNSDVAFDYMSWYGQKIARLQHLWLDPRMDMWLNMLNGKPVFRTK